MKHVHYASAAVLFACFILFATWLFRKSNIPDAKDRPPDKRRRDNACLACGIIMFGSVLWAASSLVTESPIFAPEAIAIVAFAVSWLVKGEAHRPVMAALRRLRAGG
jgi:hypothetical protein